MGKQEEVGVILKCPYCVRKTRTKIYENTLMLHFPLFCQWCKKEYVITVVECSMIVEKKPGKENAI